MTKHKQEVGKVCRRQTRTIRGIKATQKQNAKKAMQR